MFVCKDQSGTLFVASENLAAALERETVRAPVNVPLALSVEVGRSGMGLRWARHGDWRTVAYAEGGCCEQRRVEGFGWCLLADGEDMPADVAEVLTFALEQTEGGE